MDAVEEVKSRLSIEDVIGEYVQLKRAGRNWRGLSPFSSEKSPSFMVSPEKQIWHDFSSGKGGNVFSFIMEVEGLEFKEALELLARKAGVDLDQFRSRSQYSGPDKAKLGTILEGASKFYQVQFSHNKIALEYVLKKRQFSKDTALEWQLGYSPNNGSALITYLRSKGYKETEITAAGLTARTYRGGVQDMFRGRLMIPLQDAFGQVIGFTARLLEDDPKAPKYINTPQTVLYDKSRHVFGLHLAKESIRKCKYAVLVEGNLDVIASHQAGVRQTVATAGTALTEPHLKALGRLTGDIRLAFDADKAGIAATERAIPIASKVKVSLSIIDIPSGKDPDELIRKDPKLWQEAIDHKSYALDWLITRYSTLLDINSAVGKREFSDVLLPIVRGLSDAVEQDHYLATIAKIIGVDKDALLSKYNTTTSDSRPVRKRIKTEPRVLDKLEVENIKAQNNFLSLMLMRPTLREFMGIIEPDMLYNDQGRSLLEFLSTHPDFHGKLDQAQLLKSEDVSDNSMQSLLDYVKIESLLYEELYHGLELNELHYEAARLQARLIANYVKRKKDSIADELGSASEVQTQKLLNEAKLYDQLLNQVKGASRGEGKR
jgi:DNA primase